VLARAARQSATTSDKTSLTKPSSPNPFYCKAAIIESMVELDRRERRAAERGPLGVGRSTTMNYGLCALALGAELGLAGAAAAAP
jgi:hypothetical protein